MALPVGIPVVWQRFNTSTMFGGCGPGQTYVVALPMETVPKEMIEEGGYKEAKIDLLKAVGVPSPGHFVFQSDCPHPVEGTTPAAPNGGYGQWHTAFLVLTEYGYRFAPAAGVPKNRHVYRSIDDE